MQRTGLLFASTPGWCWVWPLGPPLGADRAHPVAVAAATGLAAAGPALVITGPSASPAAFQRSRLPSFSPSPATPDAEPDRSAPAFSASFRDPSTWHGHGRPDRRGAYPPGAVAHLAVDPGGTAMTVLPPRPPAARTSRADGKRRRRAVYAAAARRPPGAVSRSSPELSFVRRARSPPPYLLALRLPSRRPGAAAQMPIDLLRWQPDFDSTAFTHRVPALHTSSTTAPPTAHCHSGRLCSLARTHSGMAVLLGMASGSSTLFRRPAVHAVAPRAMGYVAVGAWWLVSQATLGDEWWALATVTTLW